jgi:ligand-binding sensor domain-containing protein/serine phosphatase RsbU (regulator of sigma subunit)
MNQVKRYPFLLSFLSMFVFAGTITRAGFAQSLTTPPLIHFLNQNPPPVVVMVPLTDAQAKGKKSVWNWGRDSVERSEPVDLEALKSVNASPAFAHFTNYTAENGLALDGLACTFADKSGNLWFGTYGGGVSCYNGKTFTNYSTSQGLADNVITSICEDKNGNLWFGNYSAGVSCYNGKTFTNYTTSQGLANNATMSICEDKNGYIWVGTNGGGVSCYNGKMFMNYTTAQGLAGNIVTCICEDKKGNLWLGTDGGGVSCYNGKTFTNYTTAQGLAINAVKSVCADKNGDLWIGTNGGGVSVFNGKTFTNYTTTQGLPGNTVQSVFEDKKGNLWFGTYGTGVSCYDGKAFTNYSTEQGLANNVVKSICEDKSGNLWFGTYGGGVSCYKGKAFSNYTTVQGLVNNIVWGICEDKSGNLWFGTDMGASCYNGKTFTNYTAAQGLAENAVMVVCEDRNRNMWLGTDGGGVSCYNGKTFTNYNTTQGLANNIVKAICEDKNGNLWFGTDGGGVSCYNGNAFTNYTTAQGLAGNTIWSIREDKRGNLWFAAYDGGVSCYNGKTFTNYTTAQGLAGNAITAIFEDERGNMWFGTDGDGLSIFDGKKIISYNTTDGLPDPLVTQITEGENGIMYIGTNLGITELVPDKNAVKGYRTGRIFNTITGYQIKDVNGAQNTLFKDSKGILWIATGSEKTALVRFDPAALQQNTPPPVVIIKSMEVNAESLCWYDLLLSVEGAAGGITDTSAFNLAMFNAFGKSVSQEVLEAQRKKFGDIQFSGITKWYPLPENLTLPYNHNSVTFNFHGIETGRNWLVRYQYILEGYDEDWSPVTEKTSATFGNIDEGAYTFKVKAQSPEGVWSEPFIYSFKVSPPWWRTWWAYSLYVLAAIALVLFIVRWNTRRLRARAEELTLKVDEATAEIKEQKHIIEEKHKEITDSINYAERIQRSFLATKELLETNLNEYFVLFRPKDVVSGDFYWAGKLSNGHFALATADSTGHGVPGAIMSLLNITSIEGAIRDGNKQPSDILNETRKTIIERLKKDGSAEGGKDGMDCTLCIFDFENRKLHIAAANNPVWIVRKSPSGISGADVIEIKPDKMPVGKHDKDQTSFTQQEIALQSGDVVYTLTDGFPDQFGGEKGKKFMSRNLRELLSANAHLSMQQQKEILENTFRTWLGNLEQVDDVTVIGIRI